MRCAKSSLFWGIGPYWEPNFVILAASLLFETGYLDASFPLGIWYISIFTRFHPLSSLFHPFFAHFHHIHSFLGPSVREAAAIRIPATQEARNTCPRWILAQQGQPTDVGTNIWNQLHHGTMQTPPRPAPQRPQVATERRAPSIPTGLCHNQGPGHARGRRHHRQATPSGNNTHTHTPQRMRHPTTEAPHVHVSLCSKSSSARAVRTDVEPCPLA